MSDNPIDFPNCRLACFTLLLRSNQVVAAELGKITHRHGGAAIDMPERVRWTLRLTARIIAGDWSRLAATALPAIARRHKRRLVETAAAKAAMQAQSTQTHAECARGVVPDRVEAEQKAAQPEQELIKTEKISDQELRAPVDGAVQQLAINTVIGIVTLARQLMAVMSSRLRLEAQAMLSNRDIGFVLPGHATETQIGTSTSPNAGRNSDTSWSGKRLDLWIAGVRAGNEKKF